MIPRSSAFQGKPHLILDRPQSKIIAPNPEFEVSKILHAKRYTDTEIPSPMKSMGINYKSSNISPACRTIGDTQKVYMGNLNAQTSYLNAAPKTGLSRIGFTSSRFGLFGADFKKTPHQARSFG